ncbi:sensor histidine kinase [uncultured Algibacter sp.]|uniref:tetratricopeptide repeat-containing sensor histidine kinase n=1 Tax=uncultured Algibacter sp. TaxID=298659 RepID=UPI002605C735|nr:sensor histidine kinase [uncultured Algibacter sp.]
MDSLKLELKKTKVDTVLTNLYLTLSAEAMDYEFDKAKFYADSALFYSLKSDNYQLAEIYNNLGLIESENGNQEFARSYYDKALTALDISDNKTVRGILYGNYSRTYENSNNIEKELEYSLKAIELNKDDDYELCFLYYNHSVIYENAGFFEEAKYYLELTREMANRSKEIRVESYASMNLAFHAMREKKYKEAEPYLERVEEICNKIDLPEVSHYLYLTLGRLQTELKNYEEAEVSITKSKDYAIRRKLERTIIESDLLMGNLEYERGNFNKAAHIYNTKNIDSFEVKSLWYADMAYRKRSLIEGKLGNYKRSNELLNTYVTYIDSVYKSENKMLLTNADRKYQTEKKDKEIATQQLELKEKESEIQKKKAQNNYMLGGIIFLVVSTILLVFLLKQRQKRKNQEILTLKREFQIKTLESLIEGEEKERLRIAKELHDGVNGDLSAIKYKLSSLLEMNNKVIKEAITMIDDSCKQVRAISHNLVPPTLEKFSLVEATEAYCNNLNSLNSNLEITFQQLGEVINIPKQAEVNIFRIIQELITNGVKHAKASNINVQISHRNNMIQVTVEDDGTGFDKNNIESPGIGLSNVQSRVDYLQADVDLISNNKGTSYAIDIDKDKLNGD